MNNQYTLLAGSMPENPFPMKPFAPVVLDFLAVLSRELRHHPITRTEPAWGALGFWLRPNHLKQLSLHLSQQEARLGRGLIFHIAPANMPTIFAYSLCISLLAGNGNIVRVSPRLAPAVTPVCDVMHSILQDDKFAVLRRQNAIVTYDRDDELTGRFSRQCDGRVVWGGDKSIAEIRTFPLPPQGVELVFADRYSFAVFDCSSIQNGTDDELRAWAHRFYNDTYEADQNACSSPRFVFWLDERGASFETAQRRWWDAVAAEASAYDLQPIKVSGKYTDAWEFAMTQPHLQSAAFRTNRLYVYTLSSLPPDITALSGSFGQFFQFPIRTLDEVLPFAVKKVQTVSTLGIDPAVLKQALVEAGAMGVDRVVPVGQALDMSVLWDGYNMLEALSRVIE